MKAKTLNVVKILGSVLAAGIITASPVYAEGLEPHIANVTEEKVQNYTDMNAWVEKAAANVNSCANIRTDAGIENERVGVLMRGCAVDVLGEKDGWSQIKSGDIEGYIRSDLLVFQEEAKELYEAEHELNADTIELEGAITLEAYQEIKAQWAREEQEAREKQRAEAVFATSSELDLLAAIIECEAGGESHEGKVAVGAVIMNRIASASFPNSISGVVYQKGQFTPAASGKLSRVLARGARSDCYQAAQDALNGQNPVGSCLYFNSGRGKGIQIGNQHFF